MRLVLERVAPAGTRSPKRVLLNGERVGDGWRELPWREGAAEGDGVGAGRKWADQYPVTVGNGPRRTRRDAEDVSNGGGEREDRRAHPELREVCNRRAVDHQREIGELIGEVGRALPQLGGRIAIVLGRRTFNVDERDEDRLA